MLIVFFFQCNLIHVRQNIIYPVVTLHIFNINFKYIYLVDVSERSILDFSDRLSAHCLTAAISLCVSKSTCLSICSLYEVHTCISGYGSCICLSVRVFNLSTLSANFTDTFVEVNTNFAEPVSSW